MKVRSIAAVSGFVASLFLFSCAPQTRLHLAKFRQAQLGPSNGGNGAAGAGAQVPGTGALSVPTSDAVVARLENGLERNAMRTSGNFSKALAQIRENLPKVSNPLQAVGFDQIQLLAYAACSDLTTGATPAMQKIYQVIPANSISSNQNALIAAGTRILDQYTGGLASQGPVSSQVKQALGSLVTNLNSVGGNTSKIAFVSVCMSATVTGTTLLGF